MKIPNQAEALTLPTSPKIKNDNGGEGKDKDKEKRLKTLLQRGKSAEGIKLPIANRDKRGRFLKGNIVGLKFTPEELKREIENYWDWAIDNKQPITMEDLAVYIGISKDTLTNYGKKDSHSDLLSKAKQICEAYMSKYLLMSSKPIGAIFCLKNNFGWSDKRDIRINRLPGEPEELTFD